MALFGMVAAHPTMKLAQLLEKGLGCFQMIVREVRRRRQLGHGFTTTLDDDHIPIHHVIQELIELRLGLHRITDTPFHGLNDIVLRTICQDYVSDTNRHYVNDYKHSRPIYPAILCAAAMMVSWGFTPSEVGKILPSVIYKLSKP